MSTYLVHPLGWEVGEPGRGSKEVFAGVDTGWGGAAGLRWPSPLWPECLCPPQMHMLKSKSSEAMV